MNPRLSVSVVIATRNRPAPLRLTLETAGKQTRCPEEIIVVDSSEDGRTREVVEKAAAQAPFAVRYFHSAVASAAGQRNHGIEQSDGEVVVFLDDDVELEPGFLAELIRPFEQDPTGRIGGVSGTIVNQTYTHPSRLNRLLLEWVLGEPASTWPGRVVGPAVNFLPLDGAAAVQSVEWLNTTGTAYRRTALETCRFGQMFSGYSFAEDLHLSCRIGKEYELVNTTRARFLHHDMGQHTHTNWVALGRSVVVNRHEVMAGVLGRNGVSDHARLFAHEILYGAVVAAISSRLRPARLWSLTKLLWGKLGGFGEIWFGPGPTGNPANGR